MFYMLRGRIPQNKTAKVTSISDLNINYFLWSLLAAEFELYEEPFDVTFPRPSTVRRVDIGQFWWRFSTD